METPTDSQARKAWKAVRKSIEAKFAEMWQQPELPGMEYRSSKCLADWLEQYRRFHAQADGNRCGA